MTSTWSAHLYAVLQDPNTPEEKKLKIAEILLPSESLRLQQTASLVQANVTTKTDEPEATDKHPYPRLDAMEALMKILANHAAANEPKVTKPTPHELDAKD